MQLKSLAQNLENPQQHNFLEILKNMSLVSGWEILEEENLLALKSPGLVPLVNIVWGDHNSFNIQKVEKFYNGKAYYWISKSLVKNQGIIKFQNPDIFPEMILDLASYSSQVIAPTIKVISPTSHSDLRLWSETAIDTFGMKLDDYQHFFYPLIKFAKCVPFLAFYNDQPAATAMVYCGKDEAGIYIMSTKKEFRRKGLGIAVLDACLLLAKSSNLRCAILYSSKLGQHLYTKLGFTINQTLYEYSFNN